MRALTLILFILSTGLWAFCLGVCICLGAVTGLLYKLIPNASPFFMNFMIYVAPCVGVVGGLIIARSTSRRLWDAD